MADRADFTTTSRVRLTPEQQAAQPEIGHAVGIVHGNQDGVVEVNWPRFRSWHKAIDLEPA